MSRTPDHSHAPPPAGARPRSSTSLHDDIVGADAMRPEFATTSYCERAPWFGVLVAVLAYTREQADARQLELPLEEDLASPPAVATVPDAASVPAERGSTECAGSCRPVLLVCWRIMAPAAALLDARDDARPVPQPVIPPGVPPGGRTRSVAAAAALARGSGRDIGPATSSA